MASKGFWGALMGVGTGIAGYGDTLTKDTLARQAEQRVADRQQSLQEISQLFQEGQAKANRAFQRGQTINSQNFTRGQTADTRAYDQTLLDPNTPQGAARIAEEERKHAADLELTQARADIYSNRGGGGILGTLQYEKYTPESFGPFLARFKELMAKPNANEDRAAEQALIEFPLTLAPKAISTGEASIRASTVESVQDELIEFLQNDKQGMIDDLIEKEVPPEELEGKTRNQLITIFKNINYNAYAPNPEWFGADPLTGMGAPTGPANNTPGSSRETAISYTEFPEDEPPPNGTWVIMPNSDRIKWPPVSR